MVIAFYKHSTSTNTEMIVTSKETASRGGTIKHHY